MKLVVLIGGGRTGIDFLQSLFDRHPEISQFPGVFYFDEFWSKVKNETNANIIVNLFIKNNKKFFDSRLNVMERHYMLGPKKKNFYLISKKVFIKKFKEFYSVSHLNKINLIKWLHLSYSYASKENLKKKKIIILHLHHVFRLKILKDLDFECIYTIRDPLASYTSLMKHWYRFGGSRNVTPETYYFHMDRMFNGVKNTLDFKKKTHIVKLEDLHLKNIKVMKHLSKKLKITYNTVMKNSTYHGKLWWGDKVSGKDLYGVNKNFKNKVDNNLFFRKDIVCIEIYLKEFITKYDYEFRVKKFKSSMLIKYLPFKLELIIWFRTIFSFNIKDIISIPFFWFKRVKVMSLNNFKKTNLPIRIGS